MSAHSSSSSSALSSPWASLLSLIPPLSPSSHKGQAGRIGVVGGSADYTGAPFFASYASMRLGADLAYTVCTESAGQVIKGYAPDCIVNTWLGGGKNESQLRTALAPLFERLHAVVIGPGLGRDEEMLRAGRVAIELAKSHSLPIVLDADGLFLLAQEPELIKGYAHALLTPNVVEFARLCKALGIEISKEEAEADHAVRDLARQMGCTVLEKGSTDRVSNGHDVLHIRAPGALKRCGGQGDVLSGCAGTLVAWTTLAPSREQVPQEQRLMLAAFGAAHVARECSRRAFEAKGRSMMAHDLLEHVGGAYVKYFEKDHEAAEAKKKEKDATKKDAAL